MTAAQANQTKDAIKLFEGGAGGEPATTATCCTTSARLYLLDSAYAQGIPLARQLLAVDPSNPDNYQLLAIAYASIKKGYDTQAKATGLIGEGLRHSARTLREQRRRRSRPTIDSAARS